MSKNVNLQVKVNTSMFNDNNFNLGTEMKNSILINENPIYRNEQNFINDNENKFIDDFDSIVNDQSSKNDITSSINLYDNINIQNSITINQSNCVSTNKNLINSTSNINLNDNDTLDLSLSLTNSQNFVKNNILTPKLVNQMNCVNFNEIKLQEDFEKKNMKNICTKASSSKNSPSQSPSTSYTCSENHKNYNCYNFDNSSIKSSVSTNASSSSSPVHYSTNNSNAFIANSSYENLNIDSTKNSLCLKDLNNTLKYSPSVETSDYYNLPLQNELNLSSNFSLPKDFLQKKENTRSNSLTQNKKNRHCLNDIEDENGVSSKTVKKFCVNNYNSNVSSLEDNTSYFNNTEAIKNNDSKFIFSNNNFSYVSTNSYVNNSPNNLINTAGSSESLVINEENDQLENFFNDSNEKIFCNHQNYRSDISYIQRHSAYGPELSNIYNSHNQMILPSSVISTPSMVNQFFSQTTKFISEPTIQCNTIDNQNFQSQFQNSSKPQQQAFIEAVSKSSIQSQNSVSLQSQTQQPSSSSLITIQEKDSNSFQNYFQHVLTANTSMASKLHEESMTYLNQGQSYEIKLRKSPLLGFSGHILKSVIRIGFQERRLQYMEKELIQQWKQQRESERILEIDIPLSYGVFEIIHPDDDINKCEFAWDPKKLAGVFIKLNCISTEFTPKKHGGEKGVPFKLIIETHTYNNKSPINMQTFIEGASCQVKVFKPKGADRKHKTDKEKMAKRSSVEQQKFLPPCDCTIFKPCSKESLFLDYNTYNSNINSLSKIKNSLSIYNKNKSKINSNSKCKNSYANFSCNGVFNNSNENFNQKNNESNNYNSSDFINSTTNSLTLTDGICSSNTNDYNVSTISSTKSSFNINENCKTNSIMQNQINSNLEKCNNLNISNLLCTNSNSNNSLANLFGIYNCSLDLISNLDNSNNFLTNSFLNSPLPNNLDSERTREWLIVNRFEKYSHLFQNYNSNDLLSLTREDLIQICNLIDGIRLFNILHFKTTIPKLTVYLCFDTGIFKAIYLNSYKCEELKEKIYKLLCENNENNSEFNFSFSNLKQLILLGPKEIKILITEEVISNFGSESMFFVDIEQDINSNNYDFLLKPYKQNN